MFKKLFLEKSNHTIVQLVRYGFVAFVAFVIDFGLLYVFTTYFHMYYLLSATLSFLLSLYVNYIMSVGWVFRQAGHKKAVQIVSFLGIGLVGLVLNLIIIWLLTSQFGLYYLLSKLVAIVIVFFWSFFGRKYLFRDTPPIELL